MSEILIVKKKKHMFQDTTISTFGGSFPMPIVSVNVEAEKVEGILVTQLTDGSRFEIWVSAT